MWAIDAADRGADPANAETTVKWTSSSSSVAVSKTGLLTPKRAGKAVITVRTENGKKARITVKVIDAKSVSITNGSSATMKVGQALQLGATVNPVQVASKLTWSSGSKKIATVSKTGLVTALKKGHRDHHRQDRQRQEGQDPDQGDG